MKRGIIIAALAAFLCAPAYCSWEGGFEPPHDHDEYSPAALDGMILSEASFGKLVIMGFIRLYQFNLSGKVSGDCNFYPSCSRYGFAAIKKYGAIKGSIMAVDRVARCNPWSTFSGYSVNYDLNLLDDPPQDNDIAGFIFDWLNF